MEHEPTPEQIAAVEHRVDTGENYYTAWMLETGSIPVISDDPESDLPAVGAQREPQADEMWTPRTALDKMNSEPSRGEPWLPYKD